ncbi:unnamed protein product [Caenorhabditis angaria]|uniref:Uncharacterized protein n=1 Tax=Caenorhabditis angaria TaxID=860376 RepID=A0A9P1N8M3_9PELO|nr:unnamed protein product [Caenorhabditis angaria]
MWAQQYQQQQNQQYQPQYYRDQSNNQYYQHFQEQTTTTINPNPNASIDFVVTQIEGLANQINTLGANGESAGLQVADHAINVFDNMKFQIDNGTIPNVDRLVDIARERFHDFPVTELIIMVIVGVILVIITLIFLFMLFGERVTAYRYRQRLSAKSDIENI